MRLIALFGLCLLVVSCAHAQKPQTTEVAQKPAPAAPAPQVKATVAPETAPDAAAELDAAMRGTTVFFDFNSDQLKPEGMDVLQRVSKVLRKYDALKLKIEGNCDERGTEEYNMMLGQKRAEAARKYLVAMGVGEKQVETISYGSNKPATDGHTEDAWAHNRRDELVRSP